MFRRLYTVLMMIVACSGGALTADVIDGEEFVDPTRPIFFEPVTAPGPDSSVTTMINNVLPSSFDLSFIRTGGAGAMAVINNQRVKVGDNIGGAQVIAIDRNSVILSINDQERRISLFDTNVKSTEGATEASRAQR